MLPDRAPDRANAAQFRGAGDIALIPLSGSAGRAESGLDLHALFCPMLRQWGSGERFRISLFAGNNARPGRDVRVG